MYTTVRSTYSQSTTDTKQTKLRSTTTSFYLLVHLNHPHIYISSGTKAWPSEFQLLRTGQPQNRWSTRCRAPYNDTIAIATGTGGPAATPASKWQQNWADNRCNAQDIGRREANVPLKRPRERVPRLHGKCNETRKLKVERRVVGRRCFASSLVGISKAGKHNRGND